jgi:hypothetical protein
MSTIYVCLFQADPASQKLQREIANCRGIPYERLVGSPVYETSSDTARSGEGSQVSQLPGEKGTANISDAKRKYRRHPKPDDHAPERPPSAYVIFSNRIREEIRGDNFSFTVIAKLVGDRWQKLEPSEKEPYESQAAAAKEHYNIQLSAYKKTDAYKEYMQYLADFKAKHAGQAEGKRPKLDKESSAGSLSAKSGEMIDINPGHRRVGSIGSMSSTGYPSSFASPAGLSLAFTAASAGNQVLGMRKPASTSPHTESPPSHLPVGPKLRTAISTQSSTSDDSWVSRADQADGVPRTGKLSIVTAPPVYHALSSFPPPEMSSSDENAWQPSRRTYQPAYRDAIPPLSAELATYQQYRPPLAGAVPSMVADERWRKALPEVTSRQIPDLPRPFHPIGQPFGTSQLPPLAGPERWSDTQHDHSQRTLPPPRQLPSPREQARGLPSLSRAMTTPGHSGAGTPTSEAGGSDTPHLDRSESDAITTLVGLASTGARESSEGQDYKRT